MGIPWDVVRHRTFGLDIFVDSAARLIAAFVFARIRRCGSAIGAIDLDLERQRLVPDR
jgi:hypothetical protein